MGYFFRFLLCIHFCVKWLRGMTFCFVAYDVACLADHDFIKKQLKIINVSKNSQITQTTICTPKGW